MRVMLTVPDATYQRVLEAQADAWTPAPDASVAQAVEWAERWAFFHALLATLAGAPQSEG